MEMKHCPRCDTTKTAAEFNKSKNQADGWQKWCRGCQSAYHQENRAEHLERQHAYHQENRAEISERKRAYNQANRAAISERRRAYRQANSAYWSERNPYLEHPTGKKECLRKHGLLPVSRFWRSALRADGLCDLCRECHGATGETRDDKAAWTHLAKTRPQCIYCGDPSEHIDHVVPRSRGGRDIATNYAPACQPCNLSKGAKWVFDFLFGTEGIPDTEKPAAYQSWDAPFLTELFAELERPDDARP